MARSYWRGHPINWDGEGWAFTDTGEVLPDRGGKIRPCKRCGKTFEGSYQGDADPCLGELPGVDNACCGHGVPEDAYIRFTNGVVVKGFTIEKDGTARVSGDDRQDDKGRDQSVLQSK